MAFTSDGTKKICVQLSDDVGNMSPTNICDTITIDTVVPIHQSYLARPFLTPMRVVPILELKEQT